MNAAFATMTVEDVVKSFPTHDIVALTGRPTYLTLKPILKGIDKCAEAIPTNQPKGHLYLTKTDAEFLALTGAAKIVQTQPPINPVIPPGATQFVIQQANRDNDRLTKTWHAHLIVSEALKKMITDNADRIFLANIDLQTATVLKIITNLKD